MIRFFLLILLILGLYLVLRSLIKNMLSSGGTGEKGSEAEELVQDPSCQIYIPKRSAIRKSLGGRDYYFCSQQCLTKFLQK